MMKIAKILLPDEGRTFKAKRWVNITLRTMHLIGAAGLGGGFLYSASKEVWLPYLVLSIASGLAMVSLYIWTHGIWLIQLRGIAILIKLILLVSLLFFPRYQAPVLITMIVISGIISHAPGDVRYFSIFHGKRMDDLSNQDPAD